MVNRKYIVQRKYLGDWTGLYYLTNLKEAKKKHKYQIEVVGVKKKDLRIILRTETITEETII